MKEARTCEICGNVAIAQVRWVNCDTKEVLPIKDVYMCRVCADLEVELAAIEVKRHYRPKKGEGRNGRF